MWFRLGYSFAVGFQVCAQVWLQVGFWLGARLAVGTRLDSVCKCVGFFDWFRVGFRLGFVCGTRAPYRIQVGHKRGACWAQVGFGVGSDRVPLSPWFPVGVRCLMQGGFRLD